MVLSARNQSLLESGTVGSPLSSPASRLVVLDVPELMISSVLFEGGLKVDEKLIEGLGATQWRVRHNALLISRMLSHQGECPGGKYLIVFSHSFLVDLTPNLLGNLIQIALTDKDSDVRSEAIDSVSILLQDRDIGGNCPLSVAYPFSVLTWTPRRRP